MKYCLSGRQSDLILKKADEIKIELRDFRSIPDYIEKFPNKTFILEMENEIPKDFDWEIIAAYAEKMEGRFYIALSDLGIMPECKLRGIKFYYKFATTSFFELNGLKNLGVSYIVVGIPLIFELKKVTSFGIPLRAIPNLAYEPYIKHENGICGGWIRPEDVDKYGQYIEVMEFYAPKALDKEAALYHVYAENKNWPGNLNLLIDHLNFDADNRLIKDEDNFAIHRMGCRQICMSGKTCHYCDNQLRYEMLVRKYRDNKNGI